MLPLVLVHGFTGSRDDWADVAPHLAADGRPVVVFDLPGHGSSPVRGAGFPASFDALVGHLLGVLDGRDVGRCHLLGHSLGGMIAMRAALASPDRFGSLVLMDTAPSPLPEIESLRPFLDVVRQEGTEFLVRYALEAPLEGEGAVIAARMGEQRYRERSARKLRDADPGVVAAVGELLLAHPDALADLGRLAMPVTVIVGSDDTPFVAPSRAMAAAVAGAVLVEIPGAGHSPQQSAPEAWLDAVRSHLARAGD